MLLSLCVFVYLCFCRFQNSLYSFGACVLLSQKGQVTLVSAVCRYLSIHTVKGAVVGVWGLFDYL